MDEAGQRAAQWARGAIERKWPGASVRGVSVLRGDASMRRFWRIAIDGAAKTPSAILTDLGSHDLPLYARELKLYPEPLPEPPWINLHRFLSALGAPVPALYEWSPAQRLMLVEDVGSLSLFDAARSNPAAGGDLYRDAVGELTRIHIDGTARAEPRCIAFQIAYDERLFAWELRRFLEFGLDAVAAGAAAARLEPDLAKLARELDGFPRVLSHRDFHGGNLFVADGGKIRIIDFQDALMAPAAQDLAVLMTTRDTSIAPALETRLLDFYFTALIRRGAPSLSHEDFLRSYSLCVLQHALKCIGLFVFLEREGKAGYAGYIPHALSHARRMLGRVGGEFPRLRELLRP